MKNDWIIIWGQEVIKRGLREECINFYKKLKNPFNMELYHIGKVEKLKCQR